MMGPASVRTGRGDDRGWTFCNVGIGSLVVGAALAAPALGADRDVGDLDAFTLVLKRQGATLEVADSTNPLMCLFGMRVPNALRIHPHRDNEGKEVAMTAEEFRRIPFDQITDLKEFSLVSNPLIRDRDLIGLSKTSVQSVKVSGGVVDGSFLACLPRDTVEDLEIKDIQLKRESLGWLQRYEVLKIVSLINVGVDDDALAMVARAPSVRTVVMKGPGVSVAGVLTLCSNPSMQFVGAEVVRPPSAKERAELDKLCEQRPDLKIVLTVVSDEERLSMCNTPLDRGVSEE